MSYLYKSLKQYAPVMLIVMIFGGLGSYLLIDSHAATPAASVQAEAGTLSSSASMISDSSASANQAVKFNLNSGGSGALACPALPAFPDASCTGWQHTGVTLIKVPTQAMTGTGWRWNGYAVVPTGANVTISGLEVDGGMDTTSNTGITIKNSWIRCTGITDWCLSIGSSTNVTDTEVGVSNGSTGYINATGIYTGGPNNQLLRVHVHGTDDGLRTDGGTTITDSYIHDLAYVAFNGAHSDGSQTTASGGPIIFTHNRVQGGNNDGLFFQAGNSIDIENNYLVYDNRGGEETSFGIGGGGSPVKGPVTIKNNVLDNAFKPAGIQNDSWPSGTVISGNKYVDGSALNP